MEEPANNAAQTNRPIEDVIRTVAPIVGTELAKELWDAGRAWGESQYQAGYRQAARDAHKAAELAILGNNSHEGNDG